MRFLRRETALSGFSLRLSFTVSIWSILGWGVQLPCSNSFSFFSTRVLYHDLLSLSSGLTLPPGSPRFYPEAAWNGVFRRAVPPPLGGALVCVGYGVGGGELSSGGLR